MDQPEDHILNLTNLNIPTEVAQDLVDILGYLVLQAGGMIVVPSTEEVERSLKGQTLAVRWDASRDDQAILTLVKTDREDS